MARASAAKAFAWASRSFDEAARAKEVRTKPMRSAFGSWVLIKSEALRSARGAVRRLTSGGRPTAAATRAFAVAIPLARFA